MFLRQSKRSHFCQNLTTLRSHRFQKTMKKFHMFQKFPQSLKKNTMCLLCQKKKIYYKKPLVPDDNYKKVSYVREIQISNNWLFLTDTCKIQVMSHQQQIHSHSCFISIVCACCSFILHVIIPVQIRTT